MGANLPQVSVPLSGWHRQCFMLGTSITLQSDTGQNREKTEGSKIEVPRDVRDSKFEMKNREINGKFCKNCLKIPTDHIYFPRHRLGKYVWSRGTRILLTFEIVNFNYFIIPKQTLNLDVELHKSNVMWHCFLKKRHRAYDNVVTS